MAEGINLYGDRRLATADGHGIDVASQRADDLDRMALECVRALLGQGLEVAALDVGCGHGGQAARLARAGARVVAVDSGDYRERVGATMRRAGIESGWAFRRVSVEDQPELGRFDVIVCQRMIHYLRHDAARRALRWLLRQAKHDGRLFISSSGMDSELGEGYAGQALPPESRFFPLAPAMAEKHSIYPPVCLYRQSELELLVADAGWVIEQAFLSAFGNVKIVALKGAATR